MSVPAGPSSVFHRLIQGISEGRWHDLADLYAGDAVVDQPFVSTAPGRIEGRETIRAHFAGAAGMGLTMVARDVVVHETADPEVVVAEFDYDVTGRAGSATAANIQVLRVRDGLITATRDYHDHLAIARATGTIPALVAAVTGRPRLTGRIAGTEEHGHSPGAGSHAAPRAVFERLIDGVSHRRWDELPGLYAEDTVVTHPFATPAEPLAGRDALRRHFAAAAGMHLEMTARDVVVHETADPEVVIGEFAYEGRVTTTGRPFTVRNVFVLRVRDGLIVESRDYADHLAFAAATGRLDVLTNTTPSG